MNKAGKSKTIEIVFEKCRILTSEPRNPDRDIELKQVPYRAQLATRIRIPGNSNDKKLDDYRQGAGYVFRLLIYSIPCPDPPPDR